MTDNQVLDELHLAIHRLADAVHDAAPVARALRSFAEQLRAVDDSPHGGERSWRGAHDALRGAAVAVGGRRRHPAAIRPLLYRALADGVIDARSFDRVMLTRTRARRILAARGARA